METPANSTDGETPKLFAVGLGKDEKAVTADEMSNLEIVKHGQHYRETLQLEKAVALYDVGIKRFPNDTILLDAYTDLCLQMEQPIKARQLIERSIQLNPNADGVKYLQLAEMLQGLPSVQMYKKGISVLENDAAKMDTAMKPEEKQNIIKQIASSWASIADIFMTDLW